MQAKVLNDAAERTYALVFATGEEVMGQLQAFARDRNLSGAHFQGLGAFSDVTLGFFDLERRDYDRIRIEEQVEVLALTGNVALAPGDERKVHAHVVVGKRDGSAHGGHLLEAHARPTLEVILTESPRYLRRSRDEATGLALIDIEIEAGAD